MGSTPYTSTAMLLPHVMWYEHVEWERASSYPLRMSGYDEWS